MKLSWELTEPEIHEAVCLLAAKRGFAVEGDMNISFVRGDRPGDPELTVKIVATVKPASNTSQR